MADGIPLTSFNHLSHSDGGYMFWETLSTSMIDGILGVRCPMFTQIYRLNIHPCSLNFAISHVFFTNHWLVTPSDFRSQTANCDFVVCLEIFLTWKWQTINHLWTGLGRGGLNWGHPIGWSYPRLWMIGFWCQAVSCRLTSFVVHRHHFLGKWRP